MGCSHRNVATARRVIEELEITAERLAGMSQAELIALFPDGRTRASREYDLPDYSRVVGLMRQNPHFTLLQAWRAYVDLGSGRRKDGYSQYCHLFNEYAVRHDIVATLLHGPGRAMFVDWAGDTVPIAVAVSDEIIKAYLWASPE